MIDWENLPSENTPFDEAILDLMQKRDIASKPIPSRHYNNKRLSANITSQIPSRK